MANLPRKVRIISIDPGSNTAGFSVLEMDTRTRKTHVLLSGTVKGTATIKQFKSIKEHYEVRFLRNLGYKYHLDALIEEWQPVAIASEAPYMGRFAATFRALTEQITLFRTCAYSYNKLRPLYLYEPSPVKVYMGVKGTSKDKNLMSKALAKRKDVSYGKGIVLAELDEHAVDSICVGLLHFSRLESWL